MSRARQFEIFGLAKRNVDLLAGGPDVEPRESVALELWDLAGCQAEGCAVEVVGVLESGGRDDEIDVVDACNHCGRLGYINCSYSGY